VNEHRRPQIGERGLGCSVRDGAAKHPDPAVDRLGGTDGVLVLVGSIARLVGREGAGLDVEGTLIPPPPFPRSRGKGELGSG
jgi:hypothetical protein